MIEQYGWPYTLMLVFLFASVFMDSVAFWKCRTMSGKELSEYATSFIKIYKIIVYLVFVAVFIFTMVTREMVLRDILIHSILGILLIMDCAISIYIKTKYKVK